MEDLYSNPAVASTVDFEHIRKGYWLSFITHGINPKERVAMDGVPFQPKVGTRFKYVYITCSIVLKYIS